MSCERNKNKQKEAGFGLFLKINNILIDVELDKFSKS